MFAFQLVAGALGVPLEDFFEQEERLAWLREKVREAGGDPKTVDAWTRRCSSCWRRRPSARRMR